MSGSPDITVTIIFHHEGPLAVPALASMGPDGDAARAAGLTIETRAVLDRANELTRHTAATNGAWLDGVEEVSVGDLGLPAMRALKPRRAISLLSLMVTIFGVPTVAVGPCLGHRAGCGGRGNLASRLPLFCSSRAISTATRQPCLYLRTILLSQA